MRLVTGGAGFLGGHVVETLVGRGERVRVADNLSTGRREVIQGHLRSKRATLVKGSLLQAPVVSRALKGVDEVWHLAADPDARAAAVHPTRQFRDGPQMTLQVLEGMRRADVRRIVFASSSVVYGEPDVYPTPESYGPCLPISSYGAGKLAAEGLVAAYVGTYGFQAWMFRFGNVVGPGMTHGVLYDFKKKLDKDPSRLEILGNGRQEKSYLSTQDCVEGMLFGLEKSRRPINLFNLASEESTDVRRIAQVLVKALGLPRVRFEFTGGDRGWPGDVRKMRLSIERMKALGWKPRHSSEEAVRRAAEWIAREG